LGGTLLLILRVRGLLPRFLGLAPSPLSPSAFRVSELFLTAAFAFGGAVILQQLVALVANRWHPAPTDGTLGFFHVLVGAGFQLGLLLGVAHAWFWHLRPSRRPSYHEPTLPHPPLPLARILRGGFFTFVAALTVVGPVSLLWQGLLEKLGIEAPPQDLISLFNRSGDAISLAVMIALAVLIAPVTEELIFRVGLFRWLRTRSARGVSLFVPALVFAMIHGNLAVLVPLVALAVILALGYEHYGHPGVPILAHALFNLNTITLLLAGFPT
jgi:hypothetical protein